MAQSSCPVALFTLSCTLLLQMGRSNAQISPDFYSKTCLDVFTAIRSQLEFAVNKEPRMGASLLHLFFHDCFVNGCDGSVLLDNMLMFIGEKNATPNRNSARGFERGFEVIDNVKSAMEKVCPGVVSCTDLLAITTHDFVILLGGPSWNVKLKRRDARTASQAATNSSLPSPASNLTDLISSFENAGLSTTNMVALAGSHSIGQAKCANFRARIYNETDLDRSFGGIRRKNCPSSVRPGDNNLAPLCKNFPDVGYIN